MFTSNNVYIIVWNQYDCKLSVGSLQTGHIGLLSPQDCGRLWRGCRFCSDLFHHQYIYWLQVNNLMVFLLSYAKICFGSGRYIAGSPEVGGNVHPAAEGSPMITGSGALLEEQGRKPLAYHFL